MKNSINLVSKKRRPSALHKRFYLISLIFFSIVFLSSAGLISYNYLLSGQLEGLKGEEADLVSSINSNPEKKIKFLTLKERLSEIQKVINKRKNINSRIVSVTDVLPQNVGISEVEGTDESISISVTAQDLASLDNLMQQRIEQYVEERGRGVKRIEMRSFSLDPESLQYEATFKLEFI